MPANRLHRRKKYVLKLIPSGILRPGIRPSSATAWWWIPLALIEEIATLEKVGVDGRRQPAHQQPRARDLPVPPADGKDVGGPREPRSQSALHPAASVPATRTRSAGAASAWPTCSTAKSFRLMFDTLAEDKRMLARPFKSPSRSTTTQIRRQYEGFAERIRPMVCDTASIPQ